MIDEKLLIDDILNNLKPRRGSKECAEQASEIIGIIKRQKQIVSQYEIPRPMEEWGEDYGDCLWWKFPIEEPPYCGNPLDSEWEEHDYDNYYTHFTRLIVPQLN